MMEEDQNTFSDTAGACKSREQLFQECIIEI